MVWMFSKPKNIKKKKKKTCVSSEKVLFSSYMLDVPCNLGFGVWMSREMILKIQICPKLTQDPGKSKKTQIFS